jgi:toxin ParE1/3/4
MKRDRISPRARLDLDEVYVYIARDNPSTARRWLQSTMQKFAWLARNPGSGEARDDFLPGLRCIPHGNYVIYFRLRSGYLEIVRVVHGARAIQWA